MRTFKAVVVDDERLSRKELTELLVEYPEIEIVGEAANAKEGIRVIEKLQPDLIFLDVQMPEKSGFDMLEALENVPSVVFVTAYDEYALKAFEISALDYIVKPIRNKRLELTIQKVLKTLTASANLSPATTNDKLTNQIFIKDGDQCYFINSPYAKKMTKNALMRLSVLITFAVHYRQLFELLYISVLS